MSKRWLNPLEVQLDKKTVKRLKTGERELKTGQYKVAASREDIDRILSSQPREGSGS